MTSYLPQRDAAVEAATSAARLIQRHAGHMQDAHVREKALHDIVTEVDEMAEEIILEVLTEQFPEYEVMAEESASDVQELEAKGFRWIIDPIDGTTNFLHGVPPYAVSIALQDRSELVVGVVLDVSRGELFTAVRGGGAYANGRRISVSPTDELNRALVTTGFPYRAFDRVDEYLETMRRVMSACRGLRRPGSASIDLAYVAAGRFDAFFETDLSPWDVAAGIVLVEEAGGRVTDFIPKERPLHAREILATNASIHDLMLEQLEPLRP